jgi:hypothetical protein
MTMSSTYDVFKTNRVVLKNVICRIRRQMSQQIKIKRDKCLKRRHMSQPIFLRQMSLTPNLIFRMTSALTLIF